MKLYTYDNNVIARDCETISDTKSSIQKLHPVSVEVKLVLYNINKQWYLGLGMVHLARGNKV